MSNVAVFAVGLLVTLLVAGAVSLLIWGAVLDGREDDRHRAGLEHPEPAMAGPEAARLDEAAGLDGVTLGTVAAG